MTSFLTMKGKIISPVEKLRGVEAATSFVALAERNFAFIVGWLLMVEPTAAKMWRLRMMMMPQQQLRQPRQQPMQQPQQLRPWTAKQHDN
mmetsp:Transcript_27136/g.50230  ORF Transcript_27136/g.50230 Transcript_27136/m.50230 type:complete len:90 (-) Transcript_27136:798-1067(-)